MKTKTPSWLEYLSTLYPIPYTLFMNIFFHLLTFPSLNVYVLAVIVPPQHRLNVLRTTMLLAFPFSHWNMLSDPMIELPRHRLNMLTITMSRPTSASVEHVNNHNASALVFNHWLNMYLTHVSIHNDWISSTSIEHVNNHNVSAHLSIGWTC